MIFFSYSEIISAIVASATLGILSGGIYKSFLIILFVAIDIIKILPRVFRHAPLAALNNFNLKGEIGSKKLTKNISDFFFFALIGLIYILLSYIYLDGVFRLYMLFFFLVGFLTAHKTLSVIFEYILIRALGLIYKVLFFMLYVLLFPLNMIIHALIRILAPIMLKLSKMHSMRKSQKILSLKMKQISSSFRKSYI